MCLLEFFVGVVNAKLLEAVHTEELKAKYIEHRCLAKTRRLPCLITERARARARERESARERASERERESERALETDRQRERATEQARDTFSTNIAPEYLC